VNTVNLPFKIDLTNKVAVITGGGGILCGAFAKALAACGAKVAVLDLRKPNADKVADEIVQNGGIAIGVECNVLEKESVENARKVVTEGLGTCDILINGAGGNHPKGTTTKEYLFKEDLLNKEEGVITFFDLDQKGIEFVFNLNFIGFFKEATNSSIECVPIIFLSLPLPSTKLSTFDTVLLYTATVKPLLSIFNTKFSPMTAKPIRPISALQHLQSQQPM
jgi:hypothetical protein